MRLAVFAAFFQAVAFSVTNAYPISGNGVNCRSGPGTSYAVKKTYPKGHDIKISCQTEGTSVNGNSIWDKTQDGCYVADYYVKTGTNGYVTDKCGSSGGGGGGGGSGSIPGPVKDDYPYKGSCGPVDKWKYFKCQCTSFVAWRINSRLGINFHNMYKGVNWGDAESWDDAARRTGVKVNKTPKPGCIAQYNGGKAGHVAWVASVGTDTVTVEEYNWNTVRGYGKRTVKKTAFDNYIHLDSRV